MVFMVSDWIMQSFFFLIFPLFHAGMVDYQHVLPVHVDVARRKGRCDEVQGPFGKIVSILSKD